MARNSHGFAVICCSRIFRFFKKSLVNVTLIVLIVWSYQIFGTWQWGCYLRGCRDRCLAGRILYPQTSKKCGTSGGRKIIIELLETRLLPCMTRWWLNQPIWKICSSNWIISPRFGVKTKNIWNHHLDDFEVLPWNCIEPPRCFSSFYAPQKSGKNTWYHPAPVADLSTELRQMSTSKSVNIWKFNGFNVLLTSDFQMCM